MDSLTAGSAVTAMVIARVVSEWRSQRMPYARIKTVPSKWEAAFPINHVRSRNIFCEKSLVIEEESLLPASQIK